MKIKLSELSDLYDIENDVPVSKDMPKQVGGKEIETVDLGDVDYETTIKYYDKKLEEED